QAYINDENIVIEGKITIEGGQFVDVIGGTYYSGGYTMTKEVIKQWDSSEEKEEITIPPISIDSDNEGISWLTKLKLDPEEEQRRMGSHKISKYEDKLYNIEEGDSVKRYMILRWVHDGVSKKVKITSTGFYNRENAMIKDSEIVEIPMITKELPLFTSSGYSIDYDVRKARFRHEVNGGVPFVAEVKLPEKNYKGWNAWWEGNTEGDLSYTLEDSKGLVNNEETIDYGEINEDNERIIREPVLIWETDKIDVYGEDLGIENAEERIDKFVINTSGGISRLAGYSYEEEYSYDECTTDENGERTCETYTDYETIYGEEVVSATFPSNTDEVEIQSLFFNGSEMPLRYFGGEIGSYEESSNREEKRILVWEGERYEIPVKRFMRYVDENGETTDIVEEDAYGGNPRIFQHLDEVEVTYKVETSLKDHFKEDREKARNNPNNYKGEIFENAPFATDTNLQWYDYPIKSGYFYRPYGEYIVTVRTTIYKEGGGGTEKHKEIVEQIKDSFETNITLPTMKINGDAVIGLDGTQYDEIPVGIEEDYFIEEEYELPYDEGPLSPEEYLYGTEESLLGGTDELYRQILQGWESSESSEYQDMYKYREYVKEGNIYKIVEETVLTFTLNPNMNKYYIVPQTKNGHYNFSIGFKSFDNGYVTVGETIKSIPVTNFDDITFTVIGSMYDDQSSR
ncbi:hypothetical protein, partial [Defluviitalea phaphyphila]|uniref:hypothetical protein n=1 Tax=Defluviitalea phaphyphila TaxID=1473580 RepID=UPI001365C115